MHKTNDTERLQTVAARLSARSVGASSRPAARFDWRPELDPDRLTMSDNLISLAGHPMLKDLNDEQRWRLHLYETVHFFSLNIVGERELMSGLAMRLYRGPLADVSEYMQHFLQEENDHSAVFAQFCLRYGRKIYPTREVRFQRAFAPGEEDFLFFAKALIFEEIADFYNHAIARDEELCSLSRDINRYHAEDEARHMIFGRRAVETLWLRFAPTWSSEVRAGALAYLRRYVDATLRTYVNPAVYRDAGLPVDPYQLRDEALALPARGAIRAPVVARIEHTLGKLEAFP